MGRRRVEHKNVIVSCSIQPQQALFLMQTPTFSLSKFLQIYLQQHMDLYEDFREWEREVLKK